MDLFYQIFQFSLKRPGEEKGRFFFSENRNKLEMHQTLQDSNFDFMRPKVTGLELLFH